MINKRYDDELISVDIIQGLDYIDKDFVENIDTLEKIIDLTKRRISFADKYDPNRQEIIKIKSKFLLEIISHGNERKWVDIESIFFSHLMIIANVDNKIHKKKSSNPIENLNNELHFLIEQLKKYLEIEKGNLKSQIDLLYDYFGLSCYVKEKNKLSLEPIFSVPPTYPEHTFFVNFNYTQLDTYYSFTREKISRINIHGTLQDNLVFGYGDEIGNEYSLIENLDDNRFLRFVKYFYYLQTQEYERLMYAINLAEFEVFIWGHSCGLSDRTLLSKIFQHSYCKKIRLFYHKKSNTENNYTDVSQNISRHFVRKEDFLDKMVYLGDSRPFPQVKNV